MPDSFSSVTTTSTSKQFSLNLNDFWKGLLMAVLLPVFTIVLQSLNAGSLVFDWHSIEVAALAGLISYLVKNFFTPSQTKITPPPGVEKVTIDIPPPGKTIKTSIAKFVILFLSIGFAANLHAQSFFKPLPKPGTKISLKSGSTLTTVQNSIRPLAGVTASLFGDGTQLAAGVGISWQHLTFDTPSQTWTTQYSISGLMFLDTKAAIITGLVFGVANGLIQIGPGINWQTKQLVILTGVGLKFN